MLKTVDGNNVAGADVAINSRLGMGTNYGSRSGSKVHGFKVAFLSPDSILEAYLCEKHPASIPNLKIADLLAILWQNQYFYENFGSSIFFLSLTLNVER